MINLTGLVHDIRKEEEKSSFERARERFQEVRDNIEQLEQPGLLTVSENGSKSNTE